MSEPTKGPSRSLLVRWGEYQFSASRSRYRRFATLENGENGRTVWVPLVCMEFRWPYGCTPDKPRSTTEAPDA
jgi:hypothetical protein